MLSIGCRLIFLMNLLELQNFWYLVFLPFLNHTFQLLSLPFFASIYICKAILIIVDADHQQYLMITIEVCQWWSVCRKGQPQSAGSESCFSFLFKVWCDTAVNLVKIGEQIILRRYGRTGMLQFISLLVGDFLIASEQMVAGEIWYLLRPWFAWHGIEKEIDGTSSVPSGSCRKQAFCRASDRKELRSKSLESNESKKCCLSQSHIPPNSLLPHLY